MNKEEQIMAAFRDLVNKWAWLNKFKMEKKLNGYKSAEVHYIEYIGKNSDSNVTKLAESLYMTRGAISKITKKLIDKGIIESYQKHWNKKELYFRLTSQGEAVMKLHEELHNEFRERDKEIFGQISEEQFNSMLCFVEKYSRHLDEEIKKLGVDGKPG